MLLLLLASIVWAFSFGLIKHRLVSVGCDPFLVAFVRLALSALLFLPLLRVRGLSVALRARLALLGAVQYGCMYLTYMMAYRYLAAHEVALFTIFTPLYVVLLDDGWQRRWRKRHLATGVLAVAGAAVVMAGSLQWAATLRGVALLQVSNLCFAIGQVAYRRLLGGVDSGATPAGGSPALRDRDVMGLLFAGGAAVALLPALPPLLYGGWPTLSSAQGWTLLYLGLVPSGVCFFLWNAGARRTRIATMAALNNAKIPLGVLVSLVCFHEPAHLPRLLAGGLILAAAVGLAERGRRDEPHS